jgi:uncharacterized membrane protein
MDDLLSAVTFVTALGCGLGAGALFAFPSFAMKAFARLQPRDGIVAMQSVNVTAVTPAFMTVLFGTGALCIAARRGGGAHRGPRCRLSPPPRPGRRRRSARGAPAGRRASCSRSLATGLVAGLFYAYSVSVMPGLATARSARQSSRS